MVHGDLVYTFSKGKKFCNYRSLFSFALAFALKVVATILPQSKSLTNFISWMNVVDTDQRQAT